MLLQPYPSSMYFYALGLCHFALINYKGAIDAFSRGIEVNGSFMPCHYAMTITYGVCGRVEEARAEAAIVKADWPNTCMEFFLDPSSRQENCRYGVVA